VSEVELNTVLNGLFDSYDRDHDSYLNAEEVEAMMRHAHRRKNSTSEEDIRRDAESFMREADKKGDGKIDIQEFLDFYKEH
jgi:Ca2+-binding EF-hand superfamily protein